jgi:primary-amine oxidase
MVLERVKQLSTHLTSSGNTPHPLDPLTEAEIEAAVKLVRASSKVPQNGLFFNAVSLWEPRKTEMMAWLASPQTVKRPNRVADVVAVGPGSKVYDGIVDLTEGEVKSWEVTPGVQPLVRMQSHQLVSELC